MSGYVESYFEEAAEHMRAVSTDAIERLAARLLTAAVEGQQVLIAGNGGSASTASHLACDLGKTVLGPAHDRVSSRFRVISLVDNAALLTAWANDVSYESVFAEQVKMHGRPGDVLVVISASGTSPNVVEAVRIARAASLDVLALLGGDGGTVVGLADDCVVVPCVDYGHIESVHLVVGHLLTRWLAERLALEEAPGARATQGTGA